MLTLSASISISGSNLLSALVSPAVSASPGCLPLPGFLTPPPFPSHCPLHYHPPTCSLYPPDFLPPPPAPPWPTSSFPVPPSGSQGLSVGTMMCRTRQLGGTSDHALRRGGARSRSHILCTFLGWGLVEFSLLTSAVLTQLLKGQVSAVPLQGLRAAGSLLPLPWRGFPRPTGQRGPGARSTGPSMCSACVCLVEPEDRAWCMLSMCCNCESHPNPMSSFFLSACLQDSSVFFCALVVYFFCW